MNGLLIELPDIQHPGGARSAGRVRSCCPVPAYRVSQQGTCTGIAERKAREPLPEEGL